MTCIKTRPCSFCPYRQDVPSGIWSEAEYEKLRDYDLPLLEQPFAVFMCHETAEDYCHGWALVHEKGDLGDGHGLLTLRFSRDFDGEWPDEVVPLFASGNEAADHGEEDIANPSQEALDAVQKLMRHHERLRYEDSDPDDLEEDEWVAAATRRVIREEPWDDDTPSE